MLSELLIENFAIVEKLLLRFDSGFTVLTGETGAGKSIIVDALQAALGSKVSSDAVRSEARLATIEAIFVPSEAESALLRDALAAQGHTDDIWDGESLILRREIGSTGRSTSRINGRAVPNALLAAVGDTLVDIHGQSDHLSILHRDRQLEVLDNFGGLLEMRQSVRDAIREHSRARQALQELAGSRRAAEQRLDLLRFQVQEIMSAKLNPDEEPELEAVRNRLANAEKLTALAGSAYEALTAGSGTALDQLQIATSGLRDLAHIDPGQASLDERLRAALYEVEDIGHELRQYRDRIEYDPSRLDEVEERLSLLQRLKRKYGANLDDVIAFGEQVRGELEEVETLDDRLTELEESAAEAERMARSRAQALSLARCAAAQTLTSALREALQGLGLKRTDFSAELSQISDGTGSAEDGDAANYVFNANGFDTVSFLVSFNPGEPPRPLEKVSSGGETSRFLLALRGVLSQADRTPTLVFDEIDVGVGGRAGAVVGERLRELARRHQVLSVTHLPQVAALAVHHLVVMKAFSKGRTTVDVRALEATDRVNEIAEMMSGTGTEAARRSAEELLAGRGMSHEP
jgi:DNA repair protein RecN (Recombination protein N)